MLFSGKQNGPFEISNNYYGLSKSGVRSLPSVVFEFVTDAKYAFVLHCSALLRFWQNSRTPCTSLDEFFRKRRISINFDQYRRVLHEVAIVSTVNGAVIF